MSRHKIPANASDLEIIVGWDKALSSYFAQVIRPDADEEGDDRIPLWIGCSTREIATPEELIGPLAAYTALSDTTLEALRADRIADLDHGPTAFQRHMLSTFSTRKA